VVPQEQQQEQEPEQKPEVVLTNYNLSQKTRNYRSPAIIKK